MFTTRNISADCQCELIFLGTLGQNMWFSLVIWKKNMKEKNMLDLVFGLRYFQNKKFKYAMTRLDIAYIQDQYLWSINWLIWDMKLVVFFLRSLHLKSRYDFFLDINENWNIFGLQSGAIYIHYKLSVRLCVFDCL